MESNTSSTMPVKKKRGGRKFLFITFLLFIIGFGIFYFICGMTYSEGTRSGILIKVSKKGFIFKTYEGEMNIGGITDGEGTIMPTTRFEFSIINDRVYDKLEAAQGKRVVVHYRQVIKNLFWQGDTDYFVDELSLVEHS